MFYFIEYLNGSKKYQLGFRFLLKHIFSEFSTGSSTDYNWSENKSNFNITLSSNDGLDLNGSDSDKRCYYLDNNVKRPVIFVTSLPIDIEVDSDNQKYLILSSLHDEGDDSVFFPILALVYLEYMSLGYLFHRSAFIPLHNKKFLVYNECKPLFQREKFMKTLLNRASNKLVRGICCLGDCKFGDCESKKIAMDNPKARFDEYSKYHFVLAMECVEKRGFLTEKILDVFLAGSIPIYWGDHLLAKTIFNPAAFICIRDFDSFEDCIDHITSMSLDQIHAMSREKMFVGGRIPELLNMTDKREGSVFFKIRKKVRALVDL
tara:strand:- start:1707 stop:2663 length:957 start_codon:yes stop_codon:yes gene_type:complete